MYAFTWYMNVVLKVDKIPYTKQNLTNRVTVCAGKALAYGYAKRPSHVTVHPRPVLQCR